MFDKYIYEDQEKKIIIEEDKVGYYIYAYEDFSRPEFCTKDYLVDSLEIAFEEVQEIFGIKKDKFVKTNKSESI